MTTRLTSKGQVTVPKKIRDYLGLRPGAAVDFVFGPHSEVIVQPAQDGSATPKADGFSKLRGPAVPSASMGSDSIDASNGVDGLNSPHPRLEVP